MASSTRIRSIVAGSVAAVLLTVLIWFIGHILPLEPRQAQQQVDGSTLNGYPVSLNAADIGETVEVPFGEEVSISELTTGKRFSHPDAFWDDNKELRETLESAGTFECFYPPFDASITGAKVVTEDAFGEWYPDYEEVRYIAHPTRQSGMVFLVDLTVVNKGDKDMMLPPLCLAGEGVWVESSAALGGATIDTQALAVIYGTRDPGGTRKQKTLPEQWNVVRANGSMKITLPFVILEGSFKSEESYQDIDLSQYHLDTLDMDPAILYRFRLG